MDPVVESLMVFHRISQSGNIVLLLLWHILHFILRLLYFVREIFRTVESYLITNGYVNTYNDLNLDRVKYLGIVVDSDEARNTSNVIELLEWLSAIGVKKVCLYDREGVLKKIKEVFMEKFSAAELPDGNSTTDPSKKQMDFEFVSISDGKELVAKAANLLFKKYYVDGDSEKPFFTETHLTDALKTLGTVEPDPDLLLIYGPARCHLGFPAWRIRYTEMVMPLDEAKVEEFYRAKLIKSILNGHMGPLKYKKYGLILKAIHRFAKVKQNYGS